MFFLTHPFLFDYVLSALEQWLESAQPILVFAVELFALSAVFRVIQGKDSAVTESFRTGLTLLLSYLLLILMYQFFPALRGQLPQLPFSRVDEHCFVLLPVCSFAEELLYSQLFRLGILTLIMNFCDALLPKEEDFSSWFLRCFLGVFAGFVLYGFFIRLIEATIPQLLGAWAKPLVLGFCGVLLLSWVLKLLLGVVLTVMNPIVGAVYGFFFSHALGKQFPKSILTTGILLSALEGLNRIGKASFSFPDFDSISFSAPLLILSICLYLFHRFL